MTRPWEKMRPMHRQGKMCERVFLFKVNQEALNGLPGCRNLWWWRSCNWKTPSYLLGCSVTHAKQAAGSRTFVLLNKGWQDFSHFWDDTFKLMTHTPSMEGTKLSMATQKPTYSSFSQNSLISNNRFHSVFETEGTFIDNLEMKDCQRRHAAKKSSKLCVCARVCVWSILNNFVFLVVITVIITKAKSLFQGEICAPRLTAGICWKLFVLLRKLHNTHVTQWSGTIAALVLVKRRSKTHTHTQKKKLSHHHRLFWNLTRWETFPLLFPEASSLLVSARGRNIQMLVVARSGWNSVAIKKQHLQRAAAESSTPEPLRRFH